MGHRIAVDEERRTIHFTNGDRMDLHNVTHFDCSGTWLRIWCDEGLVVVDPDKINAHVIKEGDHVPGNSLVGEYLAALMRDQTISTN